MSTNICAKYRKVILIADIKEFKLKIMGILSEQEVKERANAFANKAQPCSEEYYNGVYWGAHLVLTTDNDILKNEPTDNDILDYFEWVMVCQSPFELQHKDGSFASGMAANYLMDSLRQEYKDEKE